jgi:hypothetical protein
LAENSGLEPQALKPHLFSKQRLSLIGLLSMKWIINIIQRIGWELFALAFPKGTHSVKELRFYRPLSTPIEADPLLAVATGVEPTLARLKVVWLYSFAYATMRVCAK